MPYILKDRNRPLPGGVSCYDPSTNFRAAAFASFEVQWRGVQAARIGNPALTKRYNLKTDDETCIRFVDEQLGRVAFDNGWTDFYIATSGGGSPGNAAPFPKLQLRGSANRVAAVAAGVKTIYEWITSKEEAVPKELSESRAKVCAHCPMNERGNLIDWFEVKAAQAIASELERKRGWDLSTPFDEKLGVCQACFCVNELSVHCPVEIKLKHITPESFKSLHEFCWVRSEKAALEK